MAPLEREIFRAGVCGIAHIDSQAAETEVKGDVDGCARRSAC